MNSFKCSVSSVQRGVAKKWNGFTPVVLPPVNEAELIKASAKSVAAFGFRTGLLSTRPMSKEEQRFVAVRLRLQS